MRKCRITVISGILRTVLSHSDDHLVSVDGLELEPVRESDRVPGVRDDVAEEDGAEGGRVLAEVVQETARELLKGAKEGFRNGLSKILFFTKILLI